jgi:hypothetical protein
LPTYRIYFNRKREAPQVWSYDEGDQRSEVNIIDYKLHNISLIEPGADFGVKVNPDTPTVWLIVHRASVQMREGVAHFFHDPHHAINKRLEELP